MTERHSQGVGRWKAHGRPMPTSAIQVDTGQCAFEECPNDADYLVKAETRGGQTAKTRVCESCSDEHQIWADDYLPEANDE